MAVINVKFRNTNFTLESDNENRLKHLVSSLNKRVEAIASEFPNVTDTKLAIISAIMLEDQLEILNEKLNKKANTQEDGSEQTREAFIDMISYLADYIEHLADRIEKR